MSLMVLPAVAMSSANGLVGTGFASQYRLQPRTFFSFLCGVCVCVLIVCFVFCGVVIVVVVMVVERSQRFCRSDCIR